MNKFIRLMALVGILATPSVFSIVGIVVANKSNESIRVNFGPTASTSEFKHLINILGYTVVQPGEEERFPSSVRSNLMHVSINNVNPHNIVADTYDLDPEKTGVYNVTEVWFEQMGELKLFGLNKEHDPVLGKKIEFAY